MVKTETNEMMNSFEKLVLHSRLLVCAHVLCDIPFFFFFFFFSMRSFA